MKPCAGLVDVCRKRAWTRAGFCRRGRSTVVRRRSPDTPRETVGSCPLALSGLGRGLSRAMGEPSDEEPSDEEPSDEEPSDEEPSDEEPSVGEPSVGELSDEELMARIAGADAR